MKAEERARKTIEALLDEFEGAFWLPDLQDNVEAVIHRHILAAEREAERATIERCVMLINNESRPGDEWVSNWRTSEANVGKTYADDEVPIFSMAEVSNVLLAISCHYAMV